MIADGGLALILRLTVHLSFPSSLHIESVVVGSVFLAGRGSLLSTHSDLLRTLLGSPVSDQWMQPRTSHCALPGRLLGAKARKMLYGERKHLSSTQLIAPVSPCILRLMKL